MIPGEPNQDMKQPFVIAGSGRSGSSFLYMVLRDHPLIALTNEAKVVDVLQRGHDLCSTPSLEHAHGLRGIVNVEYVPLLTKLYDKHAAQFLEDFYASCFPDREFTHWGDKLPSARGVLGLTRMLPNTKVILLARDPRDVVCSYRAFAKKVQATAKDRREYAEDDHAANWCAVYEQLLALPDYYLLKYPDLVTEPEKAIRGVLAYLGLVIGKACQRAIEANVIFPFHGTSKTPGDSIGRWQRDLAADEAEAIRQRCGPLMQRLGLD